MCIEKPKKQWLNPRVTKFGNVQDITRQNGLAFTDVPIGTPNTGPGSVTGDPTS